MIWNVLASPAQKSKPRIPRDVRIYAIGDIHGRADLLEALLKNIDASLEKFRIKHAIEVYLGDYIDRGPNSREVIETLITRKSERAMICLKGNHESYALQVLDDAAVLPEWKQFGGLNTLLSYEVKLATRDVPQKDQDVAAAFRDAFPASHREFIQGLTPSFMLGDYFFAHAGVRPGIPLNEQREQDLLWIREDFLLHEEDFGKVIVHGHTPVLEPDLRPNRINIDTGAYATGRLSCLVLQDDRIAII